MLRRVLELGRHRVAAGDAVATPEEADAGAGLAGLRGFYREIGIGGRPHRVYFEEAGSGRDMLLLHTAGADGRQFHHLLRDDDLRRDHHLVAPAPPWHGRSFPPAGALPGDYRLSTDLYVETVVAMVESLNLRRPIVMGSSMAGLICLELAYRHPDLFGGVVACEASDVVPGRQVRWARHPEVNQSVFVPDSQAGFGAFFGDILMLIGAERTAADNGHELPAVNPYTGREFATFPDASPGDVHAAVAAARSAFTGVWSAVPGLERARLLHRLADLLTEHADVLGLLECTDNGKLLRETTGQVRSAARNYRFFAGYADKLYGRTIPLDSPDMLDYTLSEPIGVAALNHGVELPDATAGQQARAGALRRHPALRLPPGAWRGGAAGVPADEERDDRPVR